jgi:hypothetical protein
MQVVEITPIGIQSLHWKFYIVWTVLNFSFIPCIYFLYPETAGRTLVHLPPHALPSPNIPLILLQEDIDAYYRDSPPLLVFRDKDVTSSKRPAKYATHEEEQVRRASSAADRAAYRRGSRVSARNEEYATKAGGEDVFEHSGGKEDV